MRAANVWPLGLLLVFFVCRTCYVCAQGVSKYQLHIITDPAKAAVKIRDLSGDYADSMSVLRALDKAVSEAQFKGYLLAAIGKPAWTGKNVTAILQLDVRYQLVKLSNGNISEQMLQQSGYRERLFSNVPFNSEQLQALFSNLLSAYSNNGYPFASVWMDSIRIVNGDISAALFAGKSHYFTFDTLVIAGNVAISRPFIQSYLDVKQGAPYNESGVRDLEKRINEFAFAESVKSPEVAFSGAKARVTVFLEKKNANQFDGVIGFLPNSDNGKLQLTGDADLKLQNTFKHAEMISFNFKGLPEQSRQLKLNLSVPGLFSGPVGAALGLDLYKQDTSFQNVDLNASISYRLGTGRTIRFFVDSRTGNLVSVQGLKNSVSLPAFADVHTVFYGLGAEVQKLDYRFNPTKGYKLIVDVSAGKKAIQKNAAIDPVLYNAVSLNSSQYRIQGRADVFIPIGRAATMNMANQTGALIGKDLFENELFRLGGFNDLRGFNEQSITASTYTFFNVEYRYLLERNSFLFAFINQSYIKKSTVQSNFKDHPLGFGAGIDFETKAGIVSLSYALGKQNNNPVDLQNGKVHFGILALF